jgi:hypothetical protein
MMFFRHEAESVSAVSRDLSQVLLPHLAMDFQDLAASSEKNGFTHENHSFRQQLA